MSHHLSRALLAVLLVLAFAPSARAEGCAINIGYRVMPIGGRVVAVWYPTSAPETLYAYGPKFSGNLAHDGPVTTACGGKVPLVVFSHGDLGCGLQSVVITESLARAGYVVAAPDHADAALCHTVEPPKGTRPAEVDQPGFFSPQKWDENSRTDRRDDIENVINTLLADREFRPVIDDGKIGLMGHSLGGYTVVGIAGGWPGWLDTRVRAVLALSPYVMPFQSKNTLANVHVPLMYQGGTLDMGITPFLKGAKGAYAAANAPAYFAVFRGAGHFGWVNCGHAKTTQDCLNDVDNMRLMTEYGIAFFDEYLKNVPQPLLGQKNSALASFDYRLAQ